MRDFRLYLILDEDIASKYGDIVEIAHQAILGGVDILQLRAKSSSDRKILKVAQAIKKLIFRSKTLFLLNDRVDLAKALAVDGVHLGQEDLPPRYARRILGKSKLIGISAHSVQQAQEAERKGADYIAIGPIFTTTIKPRSTALTPQIFTKLKGKIKIPWVAVGGINLENLAQLLNMGVKRVAICRAIIQARDVFKATREFRQRLYAK